MKLYNTLSRSIEEFKPQSPPAVSLYVCGPTVYDVPHIGHARSAYTFDLLRRTLTARGYKVNFVRNVTDVDDKIIERAKQEFAGSSDLNAACRQVSEKYLKSYHETMGQLGILRPDIEPKATEHVDTLPKGGFGSMTDLIGKLLTQGAAYEAGGDVYFAVRKFPGYGKLSNRTLDELQTGTRIEPGEGKQDPMDFALWKRAKPGEPSWKSPWGEGRPGWHIECSAMSTHYLGDSFDIHGGGVDLIFPHHENEVAQAQAAGKPFARTWVHNGLLTVNGEKMSKSLGNYTTVEKALEDSHGDTRILKVFFLGSHYRSPVDYSSANLKAAASRWNGWYSFLYAAENLRDSSTKLETLPTELVNFRNEFQNQMDNDLNTPGALAALDGIVKLGQLWWKELEASGNKTQQEIGLLRGKIVCVLDIFIKLGEELGLEWRTIPKPGAEEINLLTEREAARKRKDFKASDSIRKELDQRGWIVEDTPLGQRLAPKR